MGGKHSRTKGHSFERWAANEFRDLGFSGARRQLEYHEDDCNGVDLMDTGPFLVQCKCLKSYAPINKIEEINGEGIHLLLTKADRKPVMAVLKWEDLKKILKDVGVAYESMNREK